MRDCTSIMNCKIFILKVVHPGLYGKIVRIIGHDLSEGFRIGFKGHTDDPVQREKENNRNQDGDDRKNQDLPGLF